MLTLKFNRLLLSEMILFWVVAVASAQTHVGSMPATWSSSDPSGIPYEERIMQFTKGNLAPNPSFELGREGINAGTKPPMAAGWERVGANVEWIEDREGAGRALEVYEGTHAVRIVRTRAGELDEAEGVVSEFIPVIPGNYDFTYDVRLQDIAGSRQRLGARLGDTVTVRVFFFDSEKKPLDSSTANPVSGTLIDASDKSYAFANYWSIEDFPWATVRARTYNYPFSEGDLPDRARYVRLFFGLKGIGTMWLDNIVFRYSKWNFTALERLKPYLDQPPTPVQRLIPTPKEVHYLREVAYLDSDRGIPPVIVLPDDPAPADRLAARTLEEKLNSVMLRAAPAGRGKIRVRVGSGDEAAEEALQARLAFAIGESSLTRKLALRPSLQAVSGREQGYIVQAEESGSGHMVLLAAETPLGRFYAAATAAQLLADDRGIYHSAKVVDYPDFLGRSYLLARWNTPEELARDMARLEEMSLCKLNKAYAGYGGQAKLWHQPDRLFEAGVAEAGRRCRESGVMTLGIMVNPYAHFEFEPASESLNDELRYAWTHGSEESLERLRQAFKIGLDAGAGTVMLLADDRVPHEGPNRMNFSLYTAEDKRRFTSLQHAQAYVINRLKAWMDQAYPGTRFEFCPPWYANEFIDRSAGKAEIYFKELASLIPTDIALIWTGPTVRSLSVDMADLRRYQDLIGRRPMFWDNTLYARSLEARAYGGYATHYPGKVRMCNLFEPLDVDRPPQFQDLNDGRHMFVNGAAHTEIYAVKFATVADYEWNTAAYDPERSLWKALSRAFGSAIGREILFFNDAYYGLYDACMWLEREGVTPELIRKGGSFLSRLRDSLGSVRRMLPNGHPLFNELEELSVRQEKRFEKLAQGPPAER